MVDMCVCDVVYVVGVIDVYVFVACLCVLLFVVITDCDL